MRAHVASLIPPSIVNPALPSNFSFSILSAYAIIPGAGKKSSRKFRPHFLAGERSLPPMRLDTFSPSIPAFWANVKASAITSRFPKIRELAISLNVGADHHGMVRWNRVRTQKYQPLSRPSPRSIAFRPTAGTNNWLRILLLAWSPLMRSINCALSATEGVPSTGQVTR